ncbi:MAG: ATP-binding cassette domain-containing protein [Arenicellales bacterium]
MDRPVIRARGLRKSFGAAEAVRGIDLDVRRGTCFGLLGPNGAGKTTTIRMILGQSPFDGGSLEVFGETMPESARAVRRRIGVVPQSDNLDPDFSVRENLRVYAGYFGLSGDVLAERIDRLLEFVALRDRAGSKIDALSGGMKRRLVFARALINDPELLVLDEPTTGLDPQVRHLIWSRLRELKHTGKTLLLTTHYMEEAQRLCDELVIIDNGRILAGGSPGSLIREHIEPEVLELQGRPERIREVLNGLEVRMESVGDTVYVYTADAPALMDQFKDDPSLNVMRRSGTLEDVFLKITGRELRE